MTRKAALITALVVALIAGAAALAMQQHATEPGTATAPRPVASIIVDDQPLPAHSVPGTITAKIEVTLGFQTLGRVTARHVDVGSVVRQGEVLARLDPDDLQGKVQAARAAAESAKVELQTAQATTARTRALAKRDVASTAQLEQAERALAAAEAADQQARSELIRALDAAGFADMRAPFDGVISAVYVNAGAVVIGGEPVVQLAAQKGREAVIDLPEAAVTRVRLDDRYEVWTESDASNRQPARVTQIEPVTDAATRTRRVHLALADDDSLRLGALIRARPLATGAPMLALPVAAILTRNGQEQVWIVTRGNGPATVELRAVRTSGPALGDRISIAEGLSAGDEVVIRGIHSLTPGQPVGRSVAP